MRIVPLFLLVVALALAGCATAQQRPTPLPPATAPSAQAAKSDSVTIATQGQAYSVAQDSSLQALEAMESARDRLPAEHRRSPAFRDAAAVEARARALHGALAYSEATTLFEVARTQYEAAASPSPQAAVPATLETAINRYAADLKASLEQADADQMGALLYRDRDWPAFFAAVKQISATVQPGWIQASPGTATVNLELALSYTAQGERQSESLQHLWTLRHQNGNWMLASVIPLQ